MIAGIALGLASIAAAAAIGLASLLITVPSSVIEFFAGPSAREQDLLKTQAQVVA